MQMQEVKGQNNSMLTDEDFDIFFSKFDVKAIEKYDGKPFTADHKERMRQSFFKRNGLPNRVDIWPELALPIDLNAK